jgi:hypothetical protein
VETGIPLVEMVKDKRNENLEARYLAIVLMHEEGYSAPEMAKALGIHRTSPHHALKSVDDLLSTYKPFKRMYLACIKRIADKENDNEIKVYATAS